MITSTANGKVKRLVNLVKKRKVRDQEGVFVTEGPRMFEEAPRERVREVYFSESFLAKAPEIWEKVKSSGIPAEILSDHVFSHVSDTQTPQGVLAVVDRKEAALEQILSETDPLLLVLDGLQDPGNLGTILRTAEALGIGRVVLLGDCCDPLSPKALRASMGAVFRLGLSLERSRQGLFSRLRGEGFRLLASVPDSAALPVTEVDFSQGPCAVFIGNEGNGLSQETIAQCQRVTIPMAGRAESLNASAAATILLWEMARAGGEGASHG